MSSNLLENIDIIVKEKDIGITEFEKNVGVCQGYFSRLKVKDSKGEEVNAFLTLLEKISKESGFSIDMLVNYKVPVNNENLLILEKVMNKIIADTNNRRIIWEEYSEDGLKKAGGINLDLFEGKCIDPEDDYSEWEYRFVSEFCKKAQINGTCYKGLVPTENDMSPNYFFVLPVSVEEKKGWEIYMIGCHDAGSYRKEILFSTLETPTDMLESKVLDLVKSIQTAKSDASISFGLKSLINEYMKY